MKVRLSPLGFWYFDEKQEVGPVESARRVVERQSVADKFGVTVKDVEDAEQVFFDGPISLRDVDEALSSTIRKDDVCKEVAFLAGILTFTEQDQINILMSGESALGKSHIALEVAAYVPEEDRLILASSSPTAFFHEFGKWDKETRTITVDLQKKLLILLDQPSYQLLERLRALLSHDQRSLTYKITDKTSGGANRTKTIKLLGFPTVFFCSAKLNMDDQEKTRMFILSPESSRDKLAESLRLGTLRNGDREKWKLYLSSNPQREWLERRLREIKAAMIHDVMLPDPERVYERFMKLHKNLAPRHQRDLPRIVSLIKAHAMLNFKQREHSPGNDRVLISTLEDEDAVFELYAKFSKASELGLSPQSFQIFEEVLKPTIGESGASKRDIGRAYFLKYGRPLSERELEKGLLPALESSGLIYREPDPLDKRRMLVYLADIGMDKELDTTGVGTPPLESISPHEANIVLTEEELTAQAFGGYGECQYTQQEIIQRLTERKLNGERLWKRLLGQSRVTQRDFGSAYFGLVPNLRMAVQKKDAAIETANAPFEKVLGKKDLNTTKTEETHEA